MKSFLTDWQQLIIVLVILVAAYLVSRVLKLVIGRYLKTHASILATEVTNYNFLKNAANFIIFVIAIIIIFFSIPTFKELGITLLASAGIFAAFLGFASQHAFSNIISGMFIVIFKPFRVGDVIEIQDNFGRIEDITLRHTVIRNFQNRRVIIPNSVISNETIINSSILDSKILNFFEIGIAYEANVDRAMEIIKEEAIKHKNFLDNRSDEEISNGKEPVVVRMTGLGDYSVNLRAYIWSPDNATGWVLKCDLYKSVKSRFDEEGIEIPYPHRTIVQKEKGGSL